MPVSYLDEYRTPKACYKKAPVRREWPTESFIRNCDQVPSLPLLEGFKEMGQPFRINKDLVPGKAKFVKEPVRG